MFGPLFASERKPKGPDLKRLQSLSFDLSGNILSIRVPLGNCTMSSKPEGITALSSNLYDIEQFERFKKDNWYTTRIIFNRAFTYASLMHPGLGTCRLLVQLVKLDDSESNLFNSSELEQQIKKRNEYVCEYSNKNQADEFSKIYPPKTYDLISTENETFLAYKIYNYLTDEPYYAIPLTSEHYITFSFNYISVKEGNEPWYLMARDLEKQIVNSVKLELTDSFRQEKAAASNL